MSRRKRWLTIYLPLLIIGLFLFIYIENNVIGITRIAISSSKLPDASEPYRIVQISDLHNKQFGKHQHILLDKIRKLDPDLIVVTGDLIDGRRYHPAISLELMEGATKIAPVYYVVGNHEYAIGNQLDAFEQELITTGVHVLRNTTVHIPFGDGEIRLVGVDDPIFNRREDGDVAKMNAYLDLAMAHIEPSEAYTILLSHRTELMDVYVDRRIDLSITGHAHGGQVRIPFVGGVFAPGQGFWPEYTEGLHEEDGYAMVTSRGLGNSGVPIRVFNRPELVLIELSRQ